MTKKTILSQQSENKNEPAECQTPGKQGNTRLRIRQLREKNKLSQKNLAEYLGCTQQNYSRYETGELELSLGVLERLAFFYETSTDYILGLSDYTDARWNDESYIRIAKSNMEERKRRAMEDGMKKKGRPKKNKE